MPSSSSRPRTRATRLDGAALAVSTSAQGIGGTRGGGHRAMEKLCCTDEAWRSSAELCGEAAAAQTLRRTAKGGRRQLMGGPQAAATRGGVRGARGLEWAAAAAAGFLGPAQEKKERGLAG